MQLPFLDLFLVFFFLFFRHFSSVLFESYELFCIFAVKEGGLTTAPMGLGPGVSAFLLFIFYMASLQLDLQVLLILLYTKLLLYHFCAF